MLDSFGTRADVARSRRALKSATLHRIGVGTVVYHHHPPSIGFFTHDSMQRNASMWSCVPLAHVNYICCSAMSGSTSRNSASSSPSHSLLRFPVTFLVMATTEGKFSLPTATSNRLLASHPHPLQAEPCCPAPLTHNRPTSNRHSCHQR